MAIDKLAYSIDEAAQASSVGRSLLYDEIRARRLRATKVGRRTIIAVDDLRAWLTAKASPQAEASS